MLCKVAPTSSDFHALARYLIQGKGGKPHPDRVQWAFTQNLGTDDALLAARYMEATASRSTRCMKPVYHLMVAWHERERPSFEVMQDVARKTLKMAGLAEHQALVMAHGDTLHRHFHIMLNRVHPETLKAWKTSEDFKRFDRIMRQLSDDYGFEYIPSHSFNPELTDELPQLPDSKSRRAAKKGANTDRMKWSNRACREFGEYLSTDLDRATTIDDLNQLAADHGLVFEPKGSGIVLGNSQGYATLSSLGLALSANGMVRRRAEPFDIKASRSPQRHWFDVDGVDITRAFMNWGFANKDDLIAAINDQQAARAASAAARDAKNRLPAHPQPAPPRRARPETRTALSTPRDGMGRPAMPLTRKPTRPKKDYIESLVRAQTDQAVIERRRRLISQHCKHMPQLQPPNLDMLPGDKPPRGRR